MRSLKSKIYVISFLILNSVLTLLSSNVISQEKQRSKPIVNIQDFFVSSGYMGDGEYGRKYITFDGACESNPRSEPTCIKIKYTFGPVRWAGIYWQNKADNWGDLPGNNYSKKRITKVTFWAKGETGKEVVEFKSGEIYNPNKKYHDSYNGTTGRITLTNEWKKYEIDLEGADLSSVIGGFCWVASRDYNSRDSITFFIDDIFFE